MSDAPLTKEQQSVALRIKKLLNLAANNSSEAEATAAAAKAQELLVEYNLSAANVDGATSVDGRREKVMVEGGHYVYQAMLWGSVAELHFCLHWVQQYRVLGQWRRKQGDGARVRVAGYRRKHRHMLIGRVVNVALTRSVAEYLQTTVERITREETQARRIAPLSQWAMSFRQGAARRICEKLEDKREQALAAERERTRQAERTASDASTATALTLFTYVDQETDANYDFVYGDGWSAEQANKRAERAAKRAADETARTAWAAAHPAEARAEEEAAREATGKRRGRTSRGSRGAGLDMGAYYTGYDAAAGVGVDEQVSSGAARGRLT